MFFHFCPLAFQKVRGVARTIGAIVRLATECVRWSSFCIIVASRKPDVWAMAGAGGFRRVQAFPAREVVWVPKVPMPVLMPRIVLTLACLVAPALLGLGDRAQAGVITLASAPEFDLASSASSSPPISQAWDFFAIQTSLVAECTIGPPQGEAGELHEGVPAAGSARSCCSFGRGSPGGSGPTRPNQSQTDTDGGVVSVGPRLTVHAPRHPAPIPHSDQLLADRFLSEISQPPRA